MAEYVEQRMEEMINEVEQMERVNLLTGDEVKELLRKRKQFEYKLQKRSKSKDDFLEYIQYESNLLRLLTMRRESTGYNHKQAEIEGSIKTRINKLFKIMEHRNQSDVTIWLSHIQFLKGSGWEEAVSRMYLRMLQVHSDKPGLWVEAASWEFENCGSAENARKILLRGLRFLPGSWILQREYVKMELLYVEQLRKRKQVLETKKDNENDDDSSEENKEDNVETDDDKVLDCSIVKLVATNAVESIKDPKFVVSLIATIRRFQFAESVVTDLFDILVEKFPSSPITWDTLAREKLKEGIVPCVEKYFEGLEKDGSKSLFQMAFTTMIDLPTIYPKSMVRITKNILKLLNHGKDHHLLSVEHIKFWLQLLDDETQNEQKAELLSEALEQFPNSVDLWTEQLMFTNKSKGSQALEKSFSEALEAVQGDNSNSVKIWEVLLSLTDSESGWELMNAEAGLLNRNNPSLRLLHLDRASYRGVASAREVYTAYKDQPPFNAALHWRMADLERAEAKVDLGQLRLVLTSLCDFHGQEEPRAWMEAAKLETEAGKPLEAAKIIARGEARLKPELRDKFAILREAADI